ncbi:hypothetical protein P3T23_004528 [Paraburkholderia sp. GAS448]|uniref:hypothetical protein n=1 Tax=Paraburkholderia sp. GAS448 TaxID=3035136 RepID=UPI003D1DE350
MATRHPAATAAEAFDKSLEGDDASASRTTTADAAASASSGARAAAKTDSSAAPAASATPSAASASTTAQPDPDIEALRARLAQAESERDTSRQAALDASRLIEQYETTGTQSVRTIRDLESRLEEADRQREETATQLRQAQRERSYAIDYSALEAVTPEAARELDEKLLRPRLMRIEDDYAQKLRDQQAAFDARVNELSTGQTRLSDSQKNASLAITNRGIAQKHPDFESLLAQAEFNRFLDARIPGTRRSYRDEMKAAYYDGDVDYVSSVVDAFRARGSTPSLRAVADAGTTRVATEPAHADQRVYTMKEYEDMSFRFRSRQISHSEWKKFRTDFDQAEAEGRVR